MLKKILVGLGREIPTMDWLITKYPHLPDTRSHPGAQPVVEPYFSQSVTEKTSSTPGAMVGSSNFGQQDSQQAARSTAPTHAGVPQRHPFDAGTSRRPQFNMQENGRADGFDQDFSNEDHKKRSRHASVEGEDGVSGHMPKKNKSGFFDTILNDSDDTEFPSFEPSLFTEGQQPRGGPAWIADMGQGGMQGSQFSLDSPPLAPQMLGRPTLAVDENGRASVVMEQREGSVEPDDDFRL